MKIIRPGKIDPKTKRFTCSYCGCVFEADQGEYCNVSYSEWVTDHIEEKCQCPTCGAMAYCGKV